MKVQSWREEFLWTLEVNDLLKANEVEITQVFQLIKTCSNGPDLFTLELEDMIFYLEAIGFSGPACLDNIGLAYSLSKMTLIDEM